ncbi:MAG: hypothetical protein QNJ57_11855 [Flavobacteriaceae bacterium]|nr:hypothetical protein [Flavobacteriaceae bacterium]
MLRSIFKQRSHYVYNYKPRYYDPRKERLKGLESESGNRISFDKTNLKSQWARAKKSSADRNANIRLAIIIAILVGLVAYYFKLHTLF